MIIDSHCHVSPHWYEEVDVLLYHMDRNNVEKAILTQMMGQYNNSYQAECVARYQDRLASVILVDVNLTNAVKTLEREAEAGAVGVRLNPADRSPGDDPFAVWRKAEALGMAVSCAGFGNEFANDGFADLIEEVPDLPIVIEHLGNVNTPGEMPPEGIVQKVYGLARYSNVKIKIHGLGEFCVRAKPAQEPFPFQQPIPPLLKLAYEAFGPERIMWGSDYPPVSGREGYRNALHLAMAQFSDKTQETCDLIFGGVAERIFLHGK